MLNHCVTLRSLSGKLLLVLFLLTGFSQGVFSQNPAKADSAAKPEKKKHWFELLSIRGYTQVRYNNLLNTNEDLKCEQCDRSWGGNGGFFIRRARLILFGDVHPRVYLYFQVDFANTIGTALHVGAIRDLYADIALDAKKEFRFRVGQSKVPFGFENMQSSQNRLPLDRADALNSAAPNERDLGVFFYWAPEGKRELFREVMKQGLKGSGDYGCLGLGVYNGQITNKAELNKSPHAVARFTWPMRIGKKQIIEPGVQAYTGIYELAPDQVSSGTGVAEDYIDRRAAATINLYPQPFGLLAEYNIGTGPRFNPVTDSVEQATLRGGFVTASYMIKIGKQVLFPFVRTQYYDGGKKQETDARSYRVFDNEIGIEWQVNPAVELVAMYTISDRRFEDFNKQDNHQKGSLLRLQLQFNY